MGEARLLFSGFRTEMVRYARSTEASTFYSCSFRSPLHIFVASIVLLSLTTLFANTSTTTFGLFAISLAQTGRPHSSVDHANRLTNESTSCQRLISRAKLECVCGRGERE